MHLTLSGKQYALVDMLHFSTICASAELESKDFVIDDNTLVTHSKHIVVYPRDNKYLVLIKPVHITDFSAKEVCKIMSKMVLKKISHANDVVEEEIPPQRLSSRNPNQRQPNRRNFR